MNAGKRKVYFWTALGFVGLCLLLTAGSVRGAGVVMVHGDQIIVDQGSLDGIAEKAELAIEPPSSTSAPTKERATALATVNRVDPYRAYATLTRTPDTGSVSRGWVVWVLNQNAPAKSLVVQVIVDDSALRVRTSYDGTRGCAGVRKDLRLQSAQTTTEQIAQEIPKTDPSVKVETPAPPPPSPTPTLPPTPQPTVPPPQPTVPPPQATTAPPQPTVPPPPPATPQPSPTPIPVPADLTVKISYSAGIGPNELFADILIIGPGGDGLDRAQVPIAQAAAKVKELLDKHIKAEKSRQTILNLHNPQPGFEIQLWLNSPDGKGYSAGISAGRRRDITVEAGSAPDQSDKVAADQSIVLRRKQSHTYGFSSNKDCYLVLYNIGPDGKITQLFPNMYAKNNKIEANKEYKILDPSLRTAKGEKVFFKVDETGPVGLEFVKALATVDPMPLTAVDLAEIEKNGFPSATPAPPQAQWGGAANSLVNHMSLVRSITVEVSAGATPEPTPPPAQQKTLEEIREYLRNLSQWSDATITFYTVD